MIDQALNTGLRNGDSSSYDVLYSLTAARLKNYCKIFIKDQVLVEDLVQNAIDRLPERQNQILVKCKLEGRRQQEVADELGISLKAVEKNLAKARNHLRQDLIARFPELSILILMILR